MKLSVCIPVYNFDVLDLVKALQFEIEKNGLDAEIVLIDDASDETFKKTNTTIENLTDQFIFLEKNVGRSIIRNLFLQFAKGDYFLFLDCDFRITNPSFIRAYLKAIEQNPEVDLFYGGFTVDKNFKNLRNYYSIKREISTNYNSKDFDTFRTANFVIRQTVFIEYPFNENLVQYGYEDYVFAKTLERDKVGYLFINNPAMHVDYSQNDVFLKKAGQGMRSLYILSKDPKYQDKIKDTKVYKTALLIQKLRLELVFRYVYGLLEKHVIKNLTSETPSIFLFDLYKLGTYISINYHEGKIDSEA